MSEIESLKIVLGKIYEPLAPLAQRIHDALTSKSSTLWVDDRGVLVLRPLDADDAWPRNSVIGTYDAVISIGWIEADLRMALRQRASTWIVDWDIPAPAFQFDGDLARKPKKRRRPVSSRSLESPKKKIDGEAHSIGK